MRRFEGEILWLCGERSSRQFPVLELSGDTDMVTAGLVTLSSIGQPEIIIVECTPAELRAYDTDGLCRLEMRVNEALGRRDLRVPELIQVHHVVPSVNESFQSFSARYRATIPRYVYRFGDEHAILSRTQSCEDFLAAGGVVSFFDGKKIGPASII